MLRLLVPPAIEPLPLAQTKLYLRVTDDVDDVLISVLIAGARQVAEHDLNRVLITQNWELTLNCFPSSAIALPRNPVQSVVEITYRDGTGVPQVLPSASYRLEAHAMIATVWHTDTTWPATDDKPNAVSVVFVAGYGDNADSVPAAIRQWMLAQVTHWYDQRSATDALRLSPTPFLAGLLDPFRIPVA